ncbi:hypothetical protein BGI42_15020 (plasmid) [Clostridium taeniosporum]|uniref:Uncharacterized protein n=1 Tax=Clostridium taeniosporum TaxID=394958 RepID=A0A1D7XP41_9CLOT|nr:hypothetical protein BGI42_15020 [Clostridium taeniosporum]
MIGLVLTKVTNIFSFEFFKLIIAVLILSILFVFLSYIFKRSFYSFWKDMDKYSMDIRIIEKTIKSKQKIYIKRIGKYYSI